MKLGIVVNDINTELADYTTTHLAMSATNHGYKVWYINVADFLYGPDENVYAHSTSLSLQQQNKRYRSSTAFINTLRGKTANKQCYAIEELDVLLLRNDPAVDVVKRPWARLMGINFGRLVMRHGVIVLNDPNGLAQAVNKMYLQYFPEQVRASTLISRNREDIKHFIKEHGGKAILKPLAGSGGRNVFLIDKHEKANVNQIIDAVFQEGYVIAQEFLSDALKGDTRLFIMNGKPLIYKGHYAAFRRVREGRDDDIRSNMTAGAVASKAKVTDSMLEIAEIVRPKLIEDGMFLVGLDIVGNKLMEINVFSPGGLCGASHLEGVNFSDGVIQSIKNKVNTRQDYHERFDNVQLATL